MTAFPFLEQPAPPGERKKSRKSEKRKTAEEHREERRQEEEGRAGPLRIDWEGLSQRIIEFQ